MLGRETAGQLEAAFEEDIRQATPVDLETWEDRPLTERIGDYLARVWQNLL